MTTTRRSDGAGTIGAGASSSVQHETPVEPEETSSSSASFPSRREGSNDVDDGECSDSDALLPTLKHPLSTPERPAKACNQTQGSSSDKKQKGSSSTNHAMDIFLNDCSPLLQGLRGDHSELELPSLTDGIKASNQAADNEETSAKFMPPPFKNELVPDRARASPSSSSRASPVICHDDHFYPSSTNDDQQSASARIPLEQERQSAMDPRNLGFDCHDNYGSGSERSLSLRRRSQSPRTAVSNRQEYITVAPLPLNNNIGDSSVSSSARSTSQQSEQSQQDGLPSSFLPREALAQAPISAPNMILRPGSPSITCSAPSSQSNQSAPERNGRLKSLRRFVRNRTSNSHRTESSSSQPSNLTTATQSLGEEDMFALSINGADPRRPVDSDNEPGSNIHPQHLYISQQIQQRSVSDHLPPVVWEESSSSESEPEVTDGRRQRAFSEPNGGRLRGFLFPRAVSPGVRRRSSRQSRSVRRHLPRSSSSSGASRPAPLSTTAAAVLFTSSQSQASVDSSNENSSSRRYGQPHQRQLNPYSQQSPTQARAASTSTFDDSARAMGVGTIDRSIITDSGGGDALSISTIGNSVMARSDPALLSGEGSTGQHSGAANPGPSSQHQHLGQNSGVPERAGGNVGGGGDTNESDPSREARVRWVRINQRFQLMITFVAVLFSVLLFSILISWIVLTSAYVITFERTCDVPLKSFYFLATLQLIVDVFRNDIMRRILLWDPSAQGSTQQGIPARVAAYNIGYLAYALLVLRIGINSVYIDGRQPESTCRLTAPELFQSSFVFVTLSLVAWATIILGYLVPFCFVAVLLTWNGYNPGESVNQARVTAGPIPGGVFPGYSSNAAPPGCIEQMRQVHLGEMGENCPQECCICMEDFRMADGMVETECGHILHKSCCSVWLRQARTCPVCRTDIPNAQQERLRNQQEQQIEGLVRQDSNPDVEQQRQHQHRQRPRVQLNSPHLPFRPGGRQEVETLIRAFRHPGPRRQRRSANNRQPNSSSNRNSSGRTGQALGSTTNENQRNDETTSTIEIAALSHQPG